jgi:Ca2+-binding RTX toxin-like protein
VSVESFIASLGPGSDSFRAGAAGVSCSVPLTVFGGDDADSIQGGSADDELNGGGGTDEFDMGSKADGSDVVNGGDGADLVSYGSRKLALTISLCSASDATGCDSATCSCLEENGESGEGDVLVNMEDADGGDGPDTITGDDLPNVLSGRSGADIIQGLAGADQIYGDGGDDRIHGGADDDLLIGGTGANTIDGEGGSGDICFVSPRDKTPQNCETKIEAQ